MTKKEFVSMSLPYGLKVVIPESNEKGCRKKVIGTVGVVFDDGSINCYDTVNACPKWYKPILYSFIYPLYKNDIDYSRFKDIVSLFKRHKDFLGLIAKGQAIDVDTLKVNPYKKK